MSYQPKLKKYLLSSQVTNFKIHLKVSRVGTVSHPFLLVLVQQHSPPFSLGATDGISNARGHEHYWYTEVMTQLNQVTK